MTKHKSTLLRLTNEITTVDRLWTDHSWLI